MLAKPVILAVLAATLVVAAIPTHAASTAATVPLTWHDSGYDLAAGYRYSIVLQSGHVWTGAAALAAITAGPLRIEMRGTHLKIMVNGDAVFDQDVGAESATVNIVVDCNGNGEIEVSGYGHVGGFELQHSYRIMVYTETVSVWPQSVTSQITISRQAMNCWVTNPSLTPEHENPASQAAYNPLLASIGNALSGGAMIAIVIVIVIAGLLIIAWVAGKLGGVRKLAKQAWAGKG